MSECSTREKNFQHVATGMLSPVLSATYVRRPGDRRTDGQKDHLMYIDTYIHTIRAYVHVTPIILDSFSLFAKGNTDDNDHAEQEVLEALQKVEDDLILKFFMAIEDQLEQRHSNFFEPSSSYHSRSFGSL